MLWGFRRANDLPGVPTGHMRAIDAGRARHMERGAADPAGETDSPFRAGLTHCRGGHRRHHAVLEPKSSLCFAFRPFLPAPSLEIAGDFC